MRSFGLVLIAGLVTAFVPSAFAEDAPAPLNPELVKTALIKDCTFDLAREPLKTIPADRQGDLCQCFADKMTDFIVKLGPEIDTEKGTEALNVEAEKIGKACEAKITGH